VFEQLDTNRGNQAEKPATHVELTGLGLAVASLVLGIISIPLSLMLVGGVCGLVGLILAAVHLSRGYPLRGIAGWGLALSIVGFICGSLFAAYYFQQARLLSRQLDQIGAAAWENWVDTEAPDFMVDDLEGNRIGLSELRGKRVVLDFWATWCAPCRMQIPHFVKLRNLYDPNDLAIVAISFEDEKTVRSFVKKQKINYQLATETISNLPPPYANVISLPTTFFIDRDGLIRYVTDGYHDFDELNELVRLLESKQGPNQSGQ